MSSDVLKEDFMNLTMEIMSTTPPSNVSIANVTTSYSEERDHLNKMNHVLNINSAALITLMFGFFILLVIAILATISCRQRKLKEKESLLKSQDSSTVDYKSLIQDAFREAIPTSEFSITNQIK